MSFSARDLVISFRPRLRAQGILCFRLKTISFAFFTLPFFTCFHGKNPCYNNAIMLCMDDTLVKEGVLVIFEELEVQNPLL